VTKYEKHKKEKRSHNLRAGPRQHINSYIT
jgi:hypothetical protein